MLEIVGVIMLILNWCLGIVVLAGLVIRRTTNLELYPGRLRNDIWLMAFFWAVASLITTFERVLDVETNSPVILSLAALLVTSRILYRYDKDWYELGKELKDEQDNSSPPQ